MTDKKLSELTELATTPADDDEVYIRDVSEAAANESKRITIANLLATLPAGTDLTGLSGLLADDQHVLDAEVLAVASDLAHAARHQNVGADEISVTGLSGLLADDQHVLDAEAVSAVEATGLALATGKNIKLVANLTSDHTWSGLTGILQAGENLTIGEVVYVKNDGKMWKAQSDAAGTMPAIAVATGTINAEAWGEFLLIGFFRDDSITFTLGDMLYVSDTVAGDFDNVAPADAGEQVQVLGKCLVGTHIIYFNPSLELVEVPA